MYCKAWFWNTPSNGIWWNFNSISFNSNLNCNSYSCLQTQFRFMLLNLNLGNILNSVWSCGQKFSWSFAQAWFPLITVKVWGVLCFASHIFCHILSLLLIKKTKVTVFLSFHLTVTQAEPVNETLRVTGSFTDKHVNPALMTIKGALYDISPTSHLLFSQYMLSGVNTQAKYKSLHHVITPGL